MCIASHIPYTTKQICHSPYSECSCIQSALLSSTGDAGTDTAISYALDPPVAKRCHVHTFVGSARIIYIRCVYSFFCRDFIKYAVIYGMHVQFWPTLHICIAHRAEGSWDRARLFSVCSPVKTLNLLCFMFWAATHIVLELGILSIACLPRKNGMDTHANTHTYTHTPIHTHTHLKPRETTNNSC